MPAVQQAIEMRDPLAADRPLASLAVVETHPIQYHAPVYRDLQVRLGIPVTGIYASDFSIVGYRDREFGESFRWDTDLTSGYTSAFLSTVAEGGARSAEYASARGLSAALRATRPAAILLTGYSPRFHRDAWIAAWRARVPILLRAETTDNARPASGLRATARSVALRTLYRTCSRCLYVGRDSRAHFLRHGVVEQRLVCAPYCVDIAAFRCDERDRARLREATRDRLGIGPNERVILFSGKLSVRKAPDLLLRAVRLLPSELRTGLTVAFLGSGELQGKLAELAASDYPIGLRFLGFQNQSQLSQYYHAADLLVLPSIHSETWGLVVNEALHHGLPCVVSNAVGCAPDLIEPGLTGEIAAAGSAESLTAAIMRALALIGRPEVRERCRQRVSGYTIEKAAEGIAEAYSAVVSPA